MTPDPPVVIDLNPREQRLYDRLRARVAAPPAGGRVGPQDLLLLLPDLTVLLVRLMRDDRVPWSSKALAFLGTGYLLSPIDLIPDLLLGPIGLIDDLLVVGTVLSRMLNHVHPDVVRSHWSGPGDVLEVVKRVSAWIEQQLTGRLKGAVRALLGPSSRTS
ncbi:MAG: DUF1232 domain-containing protein [Proteobacteria bacterium]|nr:DUF1232 domain-containing protein [Pseudomonadota bacterium]